MFLGVPYGAVVPPSQMVFLLRFYKTIDYILYFHKNALFDTNLFWFSWFKHFSREIFMAQFTHFFCNFFRHEKWTPPNFPLLEVIIGPWLYDKILDYCVLFKSEHHCKHTNRYHIHTLKTLVDNWISRLQYSCAHCPGVDPKQSYGFYTGGLDEDFLPHTPGQQGVLNIVSNPPEQIITSWEHGCPAGKDICPAILKLVFFSQ